MINDIEKTIILCNNFALEIKEKELIKKQIINAIEKYKCYIFDYSDGENLIPIYDYLNDNDSINIYIPSQVLQNYYPDAKIYANPPCNLYDTPDMVNSS